MCWAVPAVVRRVEGGVAYVDVGDGIERPALLGIDEGEVGAGDIVMVHAGVIIARVDLSALRESIEAWKQMAVELAARAGEDPEAAAKEIEKEVGRVLKIAEELRAGARAAT
ncbi:MAG: HypC/HybG/HupF family hydrogenase formation chaperone [Thermoproteaceae archaeon]|nr:HypC/HybG/HupF family hydrogenase formation chaperone [Thermoproteaceae archaeon]